MFASVQAAGAALVLKLHELTGIQPDAEKALKKSQDSDASDNRSTTSSSGGGPAAYETQKMIAQTIQAVDEYLLFHFGAAADMMPYEFGPQDALDFTSRLGSLGLRFKPSSSSLRALDIGCAVGGASFELAKWCDEVIGIDFSHAFVRVAEQMRTDGELPFSMLEEGEIHVPRLARRPEIDISRVSFQQVNPGGILVLVSPHSWLPGWTDRSQWLGGYVDADGPHRTADGVAGVLRPHFTLLHQQDVPFLIREHVRKFQYGVSHATVWLRNAD